MEDEYMQLRELGLSKLAVACYKSLYEDGYTHIGALARRMHKTPNGLHRVMAILETKGFRRIYRYETGWRYYVAQPLYQVLLDYQAHQRLQLNNLIRLQEKQAHIRMRRQFE